MREKKIALFPGSFDPFTLGHKVLVDEGLEIFDEIVIAIGINSDKHGLLSDAAKVRLIRDIYRNDARIKVEFYTGLTTEFCREHEIRFLLRGMRNSVDFEYERNMMQINTMLYPDLTTVLLFTPPKYVAISSSTVRELVRFGADTQQFMPEGIELKKYM